MFVIYNLMSIDLELEYKLQTLILKQEIYIKTEYNIKEHEHVHIKRSLTLKSKNRTKNG